jgi:hypothetical protein
VKSRRKTADDSCLLKCLVIQGILDSGTNTTRDILNKKLKNHVKPVISVHRKAGKNTIIYNSHEYGTRILQPTYQVFMGATITSLEEAKRKKPRESPLSSWLEIVFTCS